MTQELDNNIKELIIEAKNLFAFLDSHSDLIINLENDLRAIHANFPFRYEIYKENGFPYYLAWENEEDNTKNYRLFLIEATNDNEIKKAIIELKIKERLSLVKYLNPFVVAFKKHLITFRENNGNI
jgi:hypothetical protein